MRLYFILAITAAVLVTAVSANAQQRLSLADRMNLLEQQVNNNQANQVLLNELNQLRSEVQELRNLLEKSQHEQEQLKQRNRDQYLDLDGRINRLEEGTSNVSSAPPDPKVTATPPLKTVSEPTPKVHGDSNAVANADDERAMYTVAFDAIKAGRYADSSELFEGFLQMYPNGVYAPNALYWLGESFYAKKDYLAAEKQFRELLSRYPTHDKASGSLLKLGLSSYAQGKTADAERTLKKVIESYPGSDPAKIAAERLKSIQASRLN